MALFKPCELLGHPYSAIRYNVAGNGKRESLKSYGDWAISSQATRKLVEGSETTMSSLRTVVYGENSTSAWQFFSVFTRSVEAQVRIKN